jgi:hypothetical protein
MTVTPTDDCCPIGHSLNNGAPEPYQLDRLGRGDSDVAVIIGGVGVEAQS